MSATTLATTEARPAATREAVPDLLGTTREGSRTRPLRRRQGESRPGDRPGRSRGPRSRPAAFAPAPGPAAPARSGVRGCSVEQPASTRRTAARVQTQLTERGIAVILVAGAMIVLAALTVVGLTALRVTGSGAEPLPPSYAAQP
jgi:hypothetical protein